LGPRGVKGLLSFDINQDLNLLLTLVRLMPTHEWASYYIRLCYGLGGS
jgi:hypothetical protein